MRKILFRGKCVDTNEWIEGYYTFDGVNHWIERPSVDSALLCMDANSIIPNTLSQFTGICDKNGVKVFEGDIFKFDDEVWASYYTSCGTEYNSWEVVNYAVIGFDDYYGRYDFVKYKFDENSVAADLHENHDIELADFINELEVVGNIYDNPELLEEYR